MLLKFKKDATQWWTLYVEAIKNRLRRDKNLSDLTNVAAARVNLELVGDNNQTHFHDNRYLPVIKAGDDSLKFAHQTMKVGLSGNITGPLTQLDVASNSIIIPTSNVQANKCMIASDTGTINRFLTFVAGDGLQSLNRNADLYFNPSAGELNAPVMKAGEVRANEVRANKVYNAVWNDYAEFFPRGCETEPGDIIMLDLEADEEAYVKADEAAKCVVGVHSDEFGHLIGGEEAPAGEDFVEHNMTKFIPVGLAGRVRVNFTGIAKKGSKVVPSSVPGCGRLFVHGQDNEDKVVGYLVESDDLICKRRLKIKLRG